MFEDEEYLSDNYFNNYDVDDNFGCNNHFCFEDHEDFHDFFPSSNEFFEEDFEEFFEDQRESYDDFRYYDHDNFGDHLDDWG